MALLWRESHTEDKGRILVASRPIPRGAAVLEDSCLVAAPDTPTAPLCVVCLGPLAGGGAACRDRAEMASHMPQRHNGLSPSNIFFARKTRRTQTKSRTLCQLKYITLYYKAIGFII